MNNRDQQEQANQQTSDAEIKGSGHRGDQGEQSRDTSRLERDGHEYSRTGESGTSEGEDHRSRSGKEELSEIGIGKGAASSQGQASREGGYENERDDQRQHTVGSTNPPESHDSWRPSADPAVGDLAPERDRDDKSN